MPNEAGFRLVQDYTYVEVEKREEVEPSPFPVELRGADVVDEVQSVNRSSCEPVESLFARMGAKSQLRTWLVQNFPECHTYVEPFGGSFKVLLWKSRRARVEIINDVDADLVSFFQCVQSDPHRLVRVINALPTHEAVVLGMRSHLANRDLQGVERAAAFYLASQSAFNASGGYGSYASSPHVLLDLSIDLPRVLQVSKRLQGVDVRSTGFERLIKATNKDLPPDKYPPGGVFFYLDPPYWNTTGYKTMQGETSFEWQAQVRLSELCYEIHQTGNKFIQTNSDHPDLEKLYGGYGCFFMERVNVRYKVNTKSEKRDLTQEFVISNFPLNTQRELNLKQKRLF